MRAKVSDQTLTLLFLIVCGSLVAAWCFYGFGHAVLGFVGICLVLLLMDLLRRFRGR